MHIFLTGGRQVGKSTLINRILAELPEMRLTGFRTVTGPGPEGTFGNVYLVPAGQEPAFLPERMVGTRCGARRSITAVPEVFDDFGVACVEADGALVLMDEIGRMEREASCFLSAVLRRLDGDIPVLGVLQYDSEIPLAKEIRKHPKVHVVEVTPENRDELFRPLLCELYREVRKHIDSAGAIVFRETDSGTQVLMIRTKNDMWSFPKGHIEHGECSRQTAVREVLEETGVEIELLPDFSYETTSATAGDSRKVSYFLARDTGGNLRPQYSEVRGAAWQSAEKVSSLLRFPEDISPFEEALKFYLSIREKL